MEETDKKYKFGELPEYDLRLNAFELGVIMGLIWLHSDRDIPNTLKEKVESIAALIYKKRSE